MNFYELLRGLVKSADMPNKDAAYGLINELEVQNAFGTMALITSDGGSHEHVVQEEIYDDGIRHIKRCALCRKNLSDAFFPPPMNTGATWRR
jgi:hypothetical protein